MGERTLYRVDFKNRSLLSTETRSVPERSIGKFALGWRMPNTGPRLVESPPVTVEETADLLIRAYFARVDNGTERAVLTPKEVIDLTELADGVFEHLSPEDQARALEIYDETINPMPRQSSKQLRTEE